MAVQIVSPEKAVEVLTIELECKKEKIEELRAHIAELTAGSEAMQEDARNNTATIKMLMAQLAELKAPIENIKYYVGNPSAWEHYDDGVSEKIRAILKAAGMA